MNKQTCNLLSIALIALATNATAQNKYFTIAEATNGMSTTLATQGLKQTSWEPGTDKLYHVVKTGNGDAWVSVSFPKGNTDTVLRFNELNKAAGGKLKAMPAIAWLDKGVAYYNANNQLREGVVTAGGFNWSNWASLPENAENITVDKSRNIAYTVDNNLWMYTKDRKAVQLTNDANKNIISGQAVHRNEFGIDGGIFFSPQGNYLAYYRMDQSMVNDYPIIDWNITPAKANNIKYPMAGGTSHEVKLCVYNPTTGKTTTIVTEGPKDQYLTCISWAPDEQSVFIAILNREQNHMWLNQYDIYTGKKIKTLFEETDKKYVEPQNPLTFIPGSNDKFIWWSQRDGFMHLYLYNTEGKLLKQLTKGQWLVNEMIGMNKAANEIIITASKESPLEKHAYAVNWNNGNMKRLDEGPGFHNITTNENGNYILDVYSAAGIPKNTTVLGTHSQYSKDLVISKNTLSDYKRPTIQSITLKANDGTPLYGKMILPVGFSATKKYPVIMYLYNGPHVQLIKNTFPESGNLWYEYMAQHGYIVFSMDGRGSSNRGMAFEQATFRNLGNVEMEDQMKGVEYLKKLPFVDAGRMGVHGWSFGGFMTTSLMLKHPGTFKCAVAGGPVMNWAMYEIMYTERYMDTPEENPDGYANTNLLNQVKNLKGKLLLIHGTDDNTVVWQHSIDFLKKCVDENVQVDYFVYPGYEHNVRGKDRVHLMQKISDYFDLYLK
jgi:dipeptidyl-peptidase 4